MQGIVEQHWPWKTDKQGIKEVRKEELPIASILTNRVSEPNGPDDCLCAEMQTNGHLRSRPKGYVSNSENLSMEA